MVHPACRPLLPGLAVLALASFCGAAAAAPGDEIRYRVRAGDTLIGLGQTLLANPAHWSRLQKLNAVADPYRIPVGTQLRIPVALLRAQPRSAEVVAVVGEARANGRALAAGETLGAGSALDTGDDGHVVLRLPDGSRLVLPARSSLRVDTLKGYAGTAAQDVRVRLDKGRVESRVAPQRGPAARYRVDTPTAVIGVRGTEFRVGVDDGASRAEVTAGRVAVSRAGERGRRAAVRELAAGFGLVARVGAGLPQAVPLLPAPSAAGLPTLFEEPLLRIPLPAMAGAHGWRLEVAEDRPDAPVLASQQLASGPARIAGLADGDYRLVLRAIDAQGLEGRDTTHAFRLKARPEPPFLGAPGDGGKASAGGVAFSWTQAPQATTYRLQLSAGEDFAAPLADVEGLGETAYRAELAPGNYRWRLASVRADGDRGPWSAAARFVVRPLPQAPEPPAIGSDTLEFRWKGEPEQRFDYQFAADESFAAPLHEGAVPEPHASLPRPGAGSYWMRVRAIDPDGFISPWTGAQKVVVPAQFPWWLLALPLLFVL
ncbi:FecR domain-containing protein [Aromatoleum diolicum]|uniref:FecR family protein n=1 Tax=Aromatoleum diolicum TaxID=75796 RepID=A0ABX1QI12_9RHOO|nr:FecR domain-containing protein [Aromatoleum diolicum]NMG77131.1 hypothetical protein [Aromatoleum diolicum]